MADPCANLNPVPEFSILRIIGVAGWGADKSVLNHGINSESGRIETITNSVFAADFMLLSMVNVGKATLCFGGRAAWFCKIMIGTSLA